MCGSPLRRAPAATLSAKATRACSSTAARAWSLSIGIGDSGLHLSEDEDLARLGAKVLGTSALVGLASRAGVTTRRLAGLAIAWTAGEREGVLVTELEWEPPLEWIEEGRRALAGEHVTQTKSVGWKTSVRENRVSGRGFQLRVGPSGLWYRFAKSGGQWQIDGHPSPDPVLLVEEM